MLLWNIFDIVIIILCLYNLYGVENNNFSIDWAKEVEKEIQTQTNMILEINKQKDDFNALESSLIEMTVLQKINSQTKKTIIYRIGRWRKNKKWE
jgi:hypothetical protein